jgi:hypothetical protein
LLQLCSKEVICSRGRSWAKVYLRVLLTVSKSWMLLKFAGAVYWIVECYFPSGCLLIDPEVLTNSLDPERLFSCFFVTFGPDLELLLEAIEFCFNSFEAVLL